MNPLFLVKFIKYKVYLIRILPFQSTIVMYMVENGTINILK